RNLSLSELIQLLRLQRDQSRSALFTAAFGSEIEEPLPSFEELTCDGIVSPSAGARYDIQLTSIHVGDRISLVCDYSTELFEAATISRWLQGIVTFLDA